MLDYGIALRMDQYDLSVHMSLRMLKVLILTCGRNKAYIRSTISNFQVLLYHKDTKTGVQKMFRGNIGCLNEESGECSFAALSRLITNCPQKNKLKYVSKMYGLLPIYRQVMQEISADVKAPLCSRSSIGNIAVDSKEVTIHRADYVLLDV